MMRRTVFLIMGLIEVIVAAVLVYLSFQVPGTADVDRSFASAAKVTDRAGRQVRLLRQQVQGLRRMELVELSHRLQTQTRSITTMLRGQSIDFDTVETMRDALGDVARGLTSFADTLDPARMGQLSSGLAQTAAFLDEKVVPAAKQAAHHLDQSAGNLREDARQLAALLKEAPPDLKAVREVYNSLGRFREGLDRMTSTLKLQHIDTMRDGFRGLESSLKTGSEQVEHLAGYTYPVVSFTGLRPEINQKSFWPEGSKIAEGMRKAAAGVTAAGKEMDAMAADLPTIRASVTESGLMVDKVREALGQALKHQDKIEPLLKEAPTHAARLTEELPKVGTDLARMLRDTDRLKDVAGALRQAQKGLDLAVARWPELQTTLGHMATALKLTHDQLDHAVRRRHEYEAAMNQTVQVADTFAALLPLITDQLDSRLDEEDHTLRELGQSLDEVGMALPSYAHTTSRLLQTGRLLAWLVAAIVGLHGAYLMLSARMGRRYSY
jgi:hypothetical protein